MGGTRILNVELGDEMTSTENTFNKWLPSIYKVCSNFIINKLINSFDECLMILFIISQIKISHILNNNILPLMTHLSDILPIITQLPDTF